MSLKKVAVLFSGEGTNLENLIKKLHLKSFDDLKVEIVAAVTNNPEANGIKRAEKYGIKTVILDHKKYKNRESFDKALVEKIFSLDVDLCILAGFMRILTPIFTKNIKAVNIHPSLLPLFRGAGAIEKSFESDMKVAGVTVHLVSEELDGGEIVDQECFKKDEKMSLEEFEMKIHSIEYELFPKAVLKVLRDF